MAGFGSIFEVAGDVGTLNVRIRDCRSSTGCADEREFGDPM